MTKSKIHSVSSISLIFIYALLGIFVTFFIIGFFLQGEFTDGNDIYNWVGLVVEIGAASGITVAVLYYTKNEQKKTNDLISKIHEITEKLDKVINEQNKLQTSRKKFLHESLYGNLIGILESSYNISQDKLIRRFTIPELKKIIELDEYTLLHHNRSVLDDKISQFGELMEPELYASVSSVRNLLQENKRDKKYMSSIIHQSKRAINAIDTSLFSIENISGIEVLKKV